MPIRQFGLLVPAVWKERRGKRVTVLFNDGESRGVVSLQNIYLKFLGVTVSMGKSHF